MKAGIACASGAAKGVFVHGVLAAFEESGFRADIYAASSSSSIPAAFAAIHELDALGGTEYWMRVWKAYEEAGHDMGRAVKTGISLVLASLQSKLFSERADRFAIAASAVVTEEAARQTQGAAARKLGQQLMISTKKRDRSWARKNLVARLLDTQTPDARERLTAQNLADALYATTRMLHAWHDPAWIDGRPYVDASYTCACPAMEVANLGAQTVIAISPECGPLYVDLFRSEVVPSSYQQATIRVIQPSHDLSDVGVDYMKASKDGAAAAFNLGKAAGNEFLASWEQ
jgi:predicted acylesterase/phospholipase RssA